MSLFRMLLRIPSPRLSREDALTIARTVCLERGWRWNRPDVVDELRHWLVWCDSDVKGSASILIDQQTGEVIDARLPPR